MGTKDAITVSGNEIPEKPDYMNVEEAFIFAGDKGPETLAEIVTRTTEAWSRTLQLYFTFRSYESITPFLQGKHTFPAAPRG